MRTSSFVALIFSLTITGSNALHAPALAQTIVTRHLAEAPASEAITNDAEAVKLTLVQQGDKYGYKDERGKMVIAAQFDNAYEFFDGLAAVRVDGKWGFIDENGTMAIAPKFDEVASFHDEVAWVRIGTQVGYINEAGKFVR